MAASRRLYEAMAEVFRNYSAAGQGLDPQVIRDLVPVLKQDNSAFKADKFVAACGMSNDIAPFGY